MAQNHPTWGLAFWKQRQRANSRWRQVGSGRPVHGPCPAKPAFSPVVYGRFGRPPNRAQTAFSGLSNGNVRRPDAKEREARLKRAGEQEQDRAYRAVNDRPRADFFLRKPPEGDSPSFTLPPSAAHRRSQTPERMAQNHPPPIPLEAGLLPFASRVFLLAPPPRRLCQNETKPSLRRAFALTRQSPDSIPPRRR
jgi:hypothetical protein